MKLLSRSSCIRKLHASHLGKPAAGHQRRQQQRARQQQQQLLLCVPRAAAANEPAVPENVDMSDPELQQQIDALLQELDPELLMVRLTQRGTLVVAVDYSLHSRFSTTTS